MATPIIKEQDPDVLAELPLDQLNAEIGRCLWGYENGGTSQGRKAFFKRLVMLEQVREGAHGVPAKQRAFRAR
ncbi:MULTISPECIES: hypothetical protein [unclassified Lysobacter]|uniref:hypothetical protein n=1 Tax=unclassified Lysobacter TaxID=2635362 RepID=UPI000AC72CA9|nr:MULTISPECIES: hypothetical protein [unclassified Lysobacter]